MQTHPDQRAQPLEDGDRWVLSEISVNRKGNSGVREQEQGRCGRCLMHRLLKDTKLGVVASWTDGWVARRFQLLTRMIAAAASNQIDWGYDEGGYGSLDLAVTTGQSSTITTGREDTSWCMGEASATWARVADPKTLHLELISLKGAGLKQGRMGVFRADQEVGRKLIDMA